MTAPKQNSCAAFLNEANRYRRRLLEFFESGVDVAEAAQQLHQWVGTVGILAYREISEKARTAEAVVGKALVPNCAIHQPRWPTRQRRRKRLPIPDLAFDSATGGTQTGGAGRVRR